MKIKVILTILFVVLVCGLLCIAANAEGLLFRASFDNGIKPDLSKGSSIFQAAGDIKTIDGIIGKAVYVDKTDSIIYQLPGNLDPKAGTISFWAKPEGWNGKNAEYHYFVMIGYEDAVKDWMLVQTNGNLFSFLGGSKEKYNVPSASISDWAENQWRLITLTWNNKRVQIYFNGEPKLEPVDWPVQPENIGSTIRLGAQLFSVSSGKTAIDEFEIYDYAMNQSQVKELYKANVKKSPVLLSKVQFLSGQNVIEPDNIATSQCGAIPMPSSQSRNNDLRVEMLIDGNFDTKYVSFQGTYPNWVEMRWAQPAAIRGMSINETETSKTANYKIDVYVNGKWKTLVGPKDNTRQPGERILETWTPVETTRIRYYMLSSTDTSATAETGITELQVMGTADWVEASKQMSKPNWQSQWIWYPEGDVSDVTRYFRKHFTISDLSSIKKAYLQIGADDSFNAYINGQLVGSGNVPTKFYNIKTKLVQGDNLVAVKAYEGSIFEGVIAEILLVKNDGSEERIVTNGKWLSHNKYVNSWFTVNFSETGWVNAKEEGMPPTCLWHPEQLYYDLSEKDEFNCTLISTEPDIIKPGSKVTIKLEMSVNKVLTEDYGFDVKIGEKVEGNPGWGSDYDIASKAFWGSYKTSTWQPGVKYPVEVSILIPDWAPHGVFPVMLDPVGNKIEGAISGSADGIVGTIKINRFDKDPQYKPAITPTTVVKYINGQPKLTVNGKILSPRIMNESAWPSYRAFGENTKAGFPIMRIMGLKWVSNSYETPEGKADTVEYFKSVDQQIRAALRINPNLYIIVLGMVRASSAWTEQFPDDATLLSDGRRLGYSLSSRRWKGQIEYDYRELVKHLMAQDFCGHVIGVYFEMAEETYYPGLNANDSTTLRENLIVGDYSPEHIRAFRLWLKDKYVTDAALKVAWNDSAVTFDNAYPDINQLRREDFMAFKDPAISKMTFDYWEFHSESMADMAIAVGKTIKDASGGKYINGLWGFYSNGFIGAGLNPGSTQHTGQQALQKVLESPYIDCLVPLNAYAHVTWGTPLVPINLTESIRRHNKMVIVENDTRAFFNTIRDMQPFFQQEMLSVVNRNPYAAVMHSDGNWWQGFASGSTGRASIPWFGEESIQAEMKVNNVIYDTAYTTGSGASASEIAVFMNNADIYGLDLMYTHMLLASCQYNEAYFDFPKLGAPIDYYQLDDVALSSMDQYKVYVFVNAFNITPAQRAIIKAAVYKTGKTVIWLYGAGFSDGATLSVNSMKDLTGFNIDVVKESTSGRINVNNQNPLTANLPSGHKIIPRSWEYDARPFAMGPTFYVNESTGILGTYESNNRAGFAVKTINGAKSVYIGAPFIDTATLRSICKASGVHLFTETDALLDASKNFILIVSGESGYNNNVSVPANSSVYDIRNQSMVASNTSTFRAQINKYDTGFYFYGTVAEVEKFAKNLKANYTNRFSDLGISIKLN